MASNLIAMASILNYKGLDTKPSNKPLNCFGQNRRSEDYDEAKRLLDEALLEEVFAFTSFWMCTIAIGLEAIAIGRDLTTDL